MNSKKILFYIVSGGIVIAALLIYALFYKLSDQPTVLQNAHIASHKKGGWGSTKEEVVTFFSKESEESNRHIARKAFIIRRPDAKANVFIFHGFTCNKHDVRFLAHALFGSVKAHMPVNVIIIDFRAHGELSQGQCCTFGRDEKYDVMGIVDFVKKDPELKNLPRIAYGFSMGAVASILAQAEDPTLFTMGIWDCPFDSSEKLLGRAIERLKISLFGYEIPLPGKGILYRYAYNPYVQGILKFALKTIARMDSTQIETCIVPIDVESAIQKIAIPSFFIVCKKDEKAPITAVKALFEQCKGCFKRLWITNGRSHFDSYFYGPEKYTFKVRRFIDKVLSGNYKTRQLERVVIDDDTENSSSILS